MLFAHLVLFGFIYPSERDVVPKWVLEELTGRLRSEMQAATGGDRICQGTLLSRAQYLVDIEHWGYTDARIADGYMQEADVELWTDAIATEEPTPVTRPVIGNE